MSSASVPRNLVRADELIAAVDGALALLEDFSAEEQELSPTPQSPISLLEQCLELCNEQHAAPSEPVRTVHHFACSGGTLITKCLAALPNTQLISEIDPLSTSQHKENSPRFAPTDVIQLMRQSTHGAETELLEELFLGNLSTIQKAAVQKGLRLILRDHSHSHFCTGVAVAERSSFRALVARSLPVVSAVTVRHPIDSFLALQANRWMHFRPFTFDEYCRRYLVFLDAYADVPIFKYEDFVAAPQAVMQDMCEVLQLAYAEHFVDVFSVIQVTGDSGRSSSVIEARERRPVQEAMLAEIQQAAHWHLLKERLRYT